MKAYARFDEILIVGYYSEQHYLSVERIPELLEGNWFDPPIDYGELP